MGISSTYKNIFSLARKKIPSSPTFFFFSLLYFIIIILGQYKYLPNMNGVLLTEQKLGSMTKDGHRDPFIRVLTLFYFGY